VAFRKNTMALKGNNNMAFRKESLALKGSHMLAFRSSILASNLMNQFQFSKFNFLVK
jgi:hypothetical protein